MSEKIKCPECGSDDVMEIISMEKRKTIKKDYACCRCHRFFSK